MAMRMGKHCFCQKPLSHSIYEARLMAQVAREQKVATQMGNQLHGRQRTAEGGGGRSLGGPRPGQEVHVWTNRPRLEQGIRRPAPKPCPAHLRWDLWLGPAPARPFANGYHPSGWRVWWDFGSRRLGRHGLPYDEHALHGPEPPQSHDRSGQDGRSQPGQLPEVVEDRLRFSPNSTAGRP